MVDEMDLAGQALEVAAWRPEAYERARAVLRGTMAESVPGAAPVPPAVPVAPVRGSGFSRTRSHRRQTWGTRGKVGIGAGIGAVAAAVAAVLVVTSAPQPAAPGAGPASRPAAVQSELVSLAAFIMAGSGSLPGNATLIIRTQTEGGIPPQVSYNLYTDGGAYYGGGDKQSLMEAIARHQDMADGSSAREVAAARYAATGDLATARKLMNNALRNNDYYDSLAERKLIWAKGAAARDALYKAKGAKHLPVMPVGKVLREDIDNEIWLSSYDALAEGAGSPQVRAGVLRLLSTMPEVTVADSRTGGKPTLTLTAGPALFGGSGEEVLTVSARTGMPVKDVSPAYGNVPSSVQAFQVLRLKLADIKAGKF
jgi:hypothetical protein